MVSQRLLTEGTMRPAVTYRDNVVGVIVRVDSLLLRSPIARHHQRHRRDKHQGLPNTHKGQAEHEYNPEGLPR
jgi:hypothetical protein